MTLHFEGGALSDLPVFIELELIGLIVDDFCEMFDFFNEIFLLVFVLLELML